MRRLAPVLVVAALVFSSGPAAAATRTSRRDCEGSREGNCNDQQNNDSYGQCKYACPTFDKSPVDHSFNGPYLQICVMPGSCTPQDKQPPKEQQPKSIACLVPFPYHCDRRP